MRDNGPVTGTEVQWPEDVLLVSQTDKGGRIIFANDMFVDVSGFSRDELVGSPHNIVRHPSMPKAAFRDLWETIKSGAPWEGLVKNRAKNGDHYWVRANVTPVTENGQVTGYISIRTKPGRAEIAEAEALYAALRDGRAQGVRLQGGSVVRTGPVGLLTRAVNSIGCNVACGIGLLIMAGIGNITASTIGVSVALRLSVLAAAALMAVGIVARSMRQMQRAFRTIEGQFAALARGDLSRAIDLVPVTELQLVTGFLRSFRARLAYAEEVRKQSERDGVMQRVAAMRTMADAVELAVNENAELTLATTGEMAGDAAGVSDATGTVNAEAGVAANAANDALVSTQTVAAAAEELSVSIREIAERVGAAAHITQGAVNGGKAAGETISQLRHEVERIGSIAALISDIASQTNLLALNATIEAARAGEAGRGFAVVANEVKKLAEQTARATGDISHQIAQIQKATDQTVDAVGHIGRQISEIDGVSTAIAAAIEEQSAATQEISRSVSLATVAARSVSDAMAGVVNVAAQTNDRAERLSTTAETLAKRTDQSRRQLVKTLRQSIADAERRIHRRREIADPCNLIIGNHVHSVRLINISEGGARVKVDGQVAVGAKGELDIPGMGLRVGCQVRAADAEGLSLAFNTLITLPENLDGAGARAA